MPDETGSEQRAVPPRSAETPVSGVPGSPPVTPGPQRGVQRAELSDGMEPYQPPPPTLVKRVRSQEPHRCRMPLANGWIVGDIARCSCGKLWQLSEPLQSRDDLRWTPPSLWTRIRLWGIGR